MDDNERILEDSKMGWREAAHNSARQEAKDAGLHGAEAEAYVQRRKKEIYAELEKTGMDGL